jgi:2-aminoadipate transaminase
VLELAERYRLPIVEDEPYRDLFFGAPPPPSLKAMSGSRGVIHIGTFAKSLSGALRLGWIAAEETAVNQLSMIKQRTDICSPSLSQLAVSAMVSNGSFDAHLARLRPVLKRRSQAMLQAISTSKPVGAMRAQPVDGGVFLWADTGPEIEVRALLAEASRQGVAFVPGDLFFPDGNGRTRLRLCFSCQPRSLIDVGIERLADAMRIVRDHGTSGRHAEPLV